MCQTPCQLRGVKLGNSLYFKYHSNGIISWKLLNTPRSNLEKLVPYLVLLEIEPGTPSSNVHRHRQMTMSTSKNGVNVHMYTYHAAGIWSFLSLNLYVGITLGTFPIVFSNKKTYVVLHFENEMQLAIFEIKIGKLLEVASSICPTYFHFFPPWRVSALLRLMFTPIKTQNGIF